MPVAESVTFSGSGSGFGNDNITSFSATRPAVTDIDDLVYYIIEFSTVFAGTKGPLVSTNGLREVGQVTNTRGVIAVFVEESDGSDGGTEPFTATTGACWHCAAVRVSAGTDDTASAAAALKVLVDNAGGATTYDADSVTPSEAGSLVISVGIAQQASAATVELPASGVTDLGGSTQTQRNQTSRIYVGSFAQGASATGAITWTSYTVASGSFVSAIQFTAGPAAGGSPVITRLAGPGGMVGPGGLVGPGLA